jgi:hypothetical protein
MRRCLSPDTKSWLLHFPLLFWSSAELFIPENLLIFNFARAGWQNIALALSPPGGTEAVGSKNERGFYT